ncbi:Uncharacterised protein [Klebsiella pneumoniae]|nr:Uncharacterised protein [Klebsiella pneumoniae]VAM69882.1 Uncharacterised protein [Klebsiella pneumoniae]
MIYVDHNLHLILLAKVSNALRLFKSYITII